MSAGRRRFVVCDGGVVCVDLRWNVVWDEVFLFVGLS